MGLVGFFKSPERAVYLMCVLLGLIVYVMFRPAGWASFAGLMVTYHLFLAYMLFFSENGINRSHSVPTTIAGHLVCVAVLTASKEILPYAFKEATSSVPAVAGLFVALWGWKIIAVLQYLITYTLATHERDYLFGGEQKKYAKTPETVSAFLAPPQMAVTGGPLQPATGEDHRDWLQDREKRKMVLYAHGTSTEHEFEQWLRARGKTQYSASITGFDAAANAS